MNNLPGLAVRDLHRNFMVLKRRSKGESEEMVFGAQRRVRRTVDSAQRHLRDGQPGRALAAVKEAISLAQRLKPGYGKNRELGFCHLVLGEIFLLEGDAERAIDEYSEAEAFLRLDATNEKELGHCLHDIATTLHQVGAPSGLVKPYIDRAAAILERYEQYRRDIVNLRDTVCGSEGDSAARIPVLRNQLARASSAEERARVSRSLAGAIIDAGVEFDFHEICQLVHDSESYFATRDLPTYVMVLGPIAALRRFRWPNWADGATSRAVDRATQEGSARLLADALRLRASFLYGLGDLEEALELALDAVARQSEALLKVESSVVRLFASKGNDEVRELALALAVELGDVELCVELIEGDRLQVLPVPLGGHVAETRGSVSSSLGTITQIGRSGVSLLSPIAVNGRSALAERQAATSRGELVEFDVALKSIGGPDAWWWGSWAGNAKLYWAVYSATVRACGVTISEVGSDLGELLLTLDSCSPASSTATYSDIVRGPLQSSYEEEHQLTAALGAAVIPRRLREELEDRYILGEPPLSLVVCGSFFSMLPMPLLGVTMHLRLVEAAVLRFAAPAVLIDRVRRRTRKRIDSYRMAIACVDPTGELRYSREIPDGAEVILGGPAVQSSLGGVIDAEVERLITELRAFDRERPGIFYYSGHAWTGFAQSDIESGLVLSGGRCLSGDILFLTDPAGGALVPFPQRVVLAACNSAGSRGGGSGEWFGISAAVLWAGSDQVVATNWNVWDCPFTGSFDLELVEKIRHAVDSAEALRLQQVEALGHWRSGILFGMELADGSRVECGAIPAVWAAYTVVGVASEAM